MYDAVTYTVRRQRMAKCRQIKFQDQKHEISRSDMFIIAYCDCYRKQAKVQCSGPKHTRCRTTVQQYLFDQSSTTFALLYQLFYPNSKGQHSIRGHFVPLVQCPALGLLCKRLMALQSVLHQSSMAPLSQTLNLRLNRVNPNPNACIGWFVMFKANVMRKRFV